MITGGIIELKVGVIADGKRHRLGAGVLDPGSDFEGPATETISHLNGVSEGELRHPIGVAREIEAAGYRSAFGVGRHGGHFPFGREKQQTVDRLAVRVGSVVAQIGVESVLLPVAMEGVLIEPVGPRREEGIAAELGVFGKSPD